MQLYTAARSSAAYRVRIGLEIKKIPREDVSIDFGAGDHRAEWYRAVNPQMLVPALVDGEAVISQSLAILEYLEETRPEPPLLPQPPAERARVRRIALAVACEIHPIQNVGVVNVLREEFGHDDADALRWYRLFVERGLGAVERLLDGDDATGRFCHGDAPTLADVLLVPQVYNARRHGCELGPCPRVVSVDAACRELEPFRRAAPEAQPDFAP